MAPFVRHACQHCQPPWHGSLSILGALLSGMALPLTLKVNGKRRRREVKDDGDALCGSHLISVSLFAYNPFSIALRISEECDRVTVNAFGK